MQATPEQRAAIETQAGRICVDAGAGSGKTRVLVERILHWIEHYGARIEDIVAITFTEKAAGEMKERLRRSFRARAPEDDPVAMSHWRELERRVETARISTIHSFCGALLRENALRLDLDPDFAVLDPTDQELLLQDTLRTGVHALLEAGFEPALRLCAAMRISELERLLRTLFRGRDRFARLREEGYPLGDAEALLARWKEDLEKESERRLRAIAALPEVKRLIARLEELEGHCSDPGESRESRRRGMLEALREILEAGKPEPIEAALRRMLAKPGKRANGKAWDSRAHFEAAEVIIKDVEKFAKGVIPEEPEDPECEAGSGTTDV